MSVQSTEICVRVSRAPHLSMDCAHANVVSWHMSCPRSDEMGFRLLGYVWLITCMKKCIIIFT